MEKDGESTVADQEPDMIDIAEHMKHPKEEEDMGTQQTVRLERGCRCGDGSLAMQWKLRKRHDETQRCHAQAARSSN